VRALDILEAHAGSPGEVAALEASSFAELSFSGPARQLRALRSAALGLDTGDSIPLSGFPRLRDRLLEQGLTYTDAAITATAAYEPFVRHVFEPLERAAGALANEGVDARMIVLALRDWGFLDPFTIDAAAGASRPMARELVQMRCVIPLVAAALRALDRGDVPSVAHGDVAAVFLGGFPPFRGGPFRYVDEVGATELAQRMDFFAREHGAAYEPPPILRDLAASGGHLYPT
jgi:hypothetical protein